MIDNNFYEPRDISRPDESSDQFSQEIHGQLGQFSQLGKPSHLTGSLSSASTESINPFIKRDGQASDLPNIQIDEFEPYVMEILRQKESIVPAHKKLEPSSDLPNNSRQSFVNINSEVLKRIFKSEASNQLPEVARKFKEFGQKFLDDKNKKDEENLQIYVSASPTNIRKDFALGTKENPYRTINDAVKAVAKDGVTINVMPGNYVENVLINKSNITLRTDFQNPAQIIGSNGAFKIGDDLSNIRISGFEIVGNNGQNAAVFISGKNISDVTVDNLHVYNGSHGAVSVWGRGISEDQAIRNINVISNSVHDQNLLNHEAITFSGNVNGFLVRGNQGFRNNNIFIDFAGGYGTSKHVELDQPRKGIIEYNYIHGASSANNPKYNYKMSAAAIYSDSGKDTTIRYNYIEKADFGIELGSEKPGFSSSGIEVYGNVVVDSNKHWLIYGGPGAGGKKSGGAVTNFSKDNVVIGNSSLEKQHNAENNDISNDSQIIFKSLEQVKYLPAPVIKIINKDQ